MPEKILITSNRVGRRKNVGRNGELYNKIVDKDGVETRTPNKKLVTFLSQKKKLAFYYDEENPKTGVTVPRTIKFNHWSYITDKQYEIDFIRNSSAFGVDVWENELPKGIRDKMRKDKELLTGAMDDFELPS